MINGILLHRVLQAITKVSDFDMVTVKLSQETLTITSSLLSVSMPMAGNERFEEFCLSCSQFKQVVKGLKTVTLGFYDDRSNLLVGDTTRTIGTVLIGGAVTVLPTINDYHEYLTISSKFRRSWSLATSTITPPVKYPEDDGLCTMLVEHDSTDVKLDSTDGYRLTVGVGFTDTIAEAEATKTLNIPYRSCLAVNELLKLNHKGTVFTSVCIQTVDGVDYMRIESGDITITAKGMIVNRFPRYEDAMPKGDPISTVSLSSSILQPLKQLWDNRSVLTHEKRGKLRKQDMRLSFNLSKTGSTIRITNRWDTEQEVSPVLDASCFLKFEVGENACFILDYTYVVIMLEGSKGDLTMEYKDRLKGLTFQDGQGNLTLIMPMIG